MESAVIVIVNNDEAIIDFLSDLSDRTPILDLDALMNENKRRSVCLATRHKKEELSTVLISNVPFIPNKKWNILALFAHKSTDQLIRYFRTEMESTPYAEKQKREVLRRIIVVTEGTLIEKQKNIV